MESVMRKNFGRVEGPTIPRTQFDRSHGHKTTIDADYLYPIFVDEVLPGDTIQMRPTYFARMATPIYPIMDNLHFDDFWFAVPMRLVWSNWHKFLGAQDDPGDSIDYTIPIKTSTTSTGYAEGSIYDYMGIPPGIPDFEHSALPLRAYQLIYNEWFRDQNLQDSITFGKGDGPDTTSFALRKRGKRHDYFTSCLPYPQKSDTAIPLPLGSTAEVFTDKGIGGAIHVYSTDTEDYESLDTATASVTLLNTTGASADLWADLSGATAATINAIRLAVTTQQFIERDARGGTRINEIIMSHFGVVSPDARVQRPEYLGGSSNPVGIHSVPQTSQTDTTPQGTMSAFGTFSSGTNGWTKSFTEHCLIIGIINVRADITYQQGIEKLWTRQTRYDFYWPEFAHIGEQAVLQQEIELTDPAGGTNENVFGYQERSAEYRYKPSRISGAFRSSAATPLDAWHLSQELETPALNDNFIQSNTPMSRVEAVSSEPDFIVDMFFRYLCTRPMPMFGTPGLTRF
jgi:hypothetical protein